MKKIGMILILCTTKPNLEADLIKRLESLSEKKFFVGHLKHDASIKPQVKWEKTCAQLSSSFYLVIREKATHPLFIGCFQTNERGWADLNNPSVTTKQMCSKIQDWLELWPQEVQENYNHFFQGDQVVHPFSPELCQREKDFQGHFQYDLKKFSKQKGELKPNFWMKQEVRFFNLFLPQKLKVQIQLEDLSQTLKVSELFQILHPLFTQPPVLFLPHPKENQIHLNFFPFQESLIPENLENTLVDQKSEQDPLNTYLMKP